MNARYTRTAAVLIAVCLAASPARANPFPDADLANGKKINDANKCAACHLQQSGLGEAAYYQRPERKVKTLFDLRRQVSLCSSQLKLSLFPEEESDLAAYLNKSFYKFEK